MLLRQVSEDTPFVSKRGASVDAWDEVAAKLSTCSTFTRTPFDGKKAQSRFLALIDKHRKYNKRSAAASGAA